MFEKFKQLKQVKNLQDALEKEKVENSKEGIKVVLNGKMEVEELQLNSSLSKEEQERYLKDCLNEALKKLKSSAIERFGQLVKPDK